MNVRNLAVEARGDRWKKKIHPGIRLIGKWLQAAGFEPGSRSRVEVVPVASGVLELRGAIATERSK